MSFADLPNVRVQNQGESIEEYARHLANLLSMYRDTLDFVINGHINFKNIQALGITTKNLKADAVTAEKINVTELSAITANMGTITAGSITTNAEINVGTDVTIGNNLNLGVSSYVGSKKITWSNDVGIVAYIDVTSGDMAIRTGGFITMTIGSSQGLVVNKVVAASALKSNTITNNSGVSVVFSGTATSSTAVADSHNHGLTSSDYIQCYDSAGVATSKKQFVPYGGSASHSHVVT